MQRHLRKKHSEADADDSSNMKNPPSEMTGADDNTKMKPADIDHDDAKKTKKNAMTAASFSRTVRPYYHCNNVVLGELTCDICFYTAFQKRVMLNHIQKKHQTDETVGVLYGAPSKRRWVKRRRLCI